jgi:hypothetical protein
MKQLKQRDNKKELSLIREIKKEGFITFRTKSLIVVICPKPKVIKFIHLQKKGLSGEEKKEMSKFKSLTDEYFCKFEVWDD